MVYRLFFFEPLRDLMFLSTTKFGGTQEDKDQKPYPATARKLAVLVYRVLSGDLIYNDPGATAYHQLNRARELKSLRKRAKLLGYQLVNHSTGEVLSIPVS